MKGEEKRQNCRECCAACIIQVLILLPARLIKWIQPERAERGSIPEEQETPRGLQVIQAIGRCSRHCSHLVF